MATESRLADIYRQELKKSGLLGALLSASGARMKEKTDIRRMLPQSGVSGAAFEKMFGKAYKYGANKGGGVRDTKGGGGGVSKSMEEKLTRIGVDSKLTAKNTVVLPAMARDMNVMRLNMQKMVKLAGGTATKSSDMFFKRASDRESQYESQYKRNSGGLAPTPVTGKKEGGGFLGMLGSLLGGAKDIVSSFGGFFKGLFGVILASGIIGQFLNDPETKANFLDFITKFLKAFFDGVKNTFEVVGEALKDKDVQASIAGAIKAIFNAILEVFKVELTKIETPFGDLSVTIGDVLLAFVGFKAAMFALETAILLRAANIGRGGGMGLPGGLGGPDGPDKGKPKGKGGFWKGLKDIGSKAGKYGLYGMGAYGAYEGYNAIFGDNNAGSNGTDGVPTDSVSKKNLGLNTDTALAVGGTALGAAGLAYSASKLTKTLTPTPTAAKPGFLMTAEEKIQSRAATQAKASSRWGRFLAFVAKKSPALFARLGVKLAAMAGLAAIPIAGWVSALFTLAFAISDIYAIYSLWSEFTGTDEETANPDVNAASTNATPVAADTTNVSPATSPTPMAAASKVTPGGATPTSPSPAASASSTSPTNLLDLIASGESGKAGYDAANKGKSGDMPGGYPGLSKMTVNDVMRLQSEGKVFATGRYQIIPKTLAGLMSGAYGNTGVKGSDLYDASTQDKLGTALINKRLQQGGGDPVKTQLALSQEFASIADPNTGKSYYEGKGNNKASISTGQIQAALSGTGTTFASAPSQQAGSPSTGNALTDLFAEYSTFRDNYMKQNGGGNTTVNAPVTNVSQSSGGGSNNTTPYNNDMMRYLLRPVT